MNEHRLIADELERQLGHWTGAAQCFVDAEEFASRHAWESLERSIGLPVRTQLAQTVDQLLENGRTTTAAVRASRLDPGRLAEAHAAVQQFRRRYVQVETTLDFFGQAVNTRTSTHLRTTLQFLDSVAYQSIEQVLRPLGLPVPPVLTYLGEGLGASILRVGIRLWAPGAVNPVAAVKIVRHNLYRPTSLFHETGHQVAHLAGWNAALADALGKTLADDPALKAMWQPWSSEIAADVYAFVLTGFASVAALHDVVGDERTLFRWPLGDPHPIGWLRTLLGCAMCRRAYGPGPWDRLERAVMTTYPASRADASSVPLILRSQRRLDAIAATCLDTPVPGFRDRPVSALVDPQRVSPSALAELERSAGPALWTSPHWRGTEGIRLIALAGLREAENPERAGEWISRARTWMTGQRSVAA
ncbi:hypothetical protein KV102_18190 [Mumia sp. zg.B53]|uniref:hypothetical protein n=1 Tax=unclassified Mumia TaxID=2621872 RepID=UPI001C6E67E0|nr:MULTISPECIES: hypothetical protein [unclassified Mumia]MBW9211605.1 hypothetical protein [Mumia sp. zg.B21]MBW9216776.1 hypothetical protein [Mumia sp. zg.B53]MDD9348537.1 hypothetical protein [Mumia sp.]